MRSLVIYPVVTLIFLIFAGINYYIGLRGRQAFRRFLPSARRYWLVFWLIVLAYPTSRFVSRFLPESLNWVQAIIGSVWLGAMFYFVLVLAMLDMVRLADYLLGLAARKTLLPWKTRPLAAPITGLAVLLLVGVTLAYGAWNAWHPRVTRYNLTISKQAGHLGHLRAALVSDIHLGSIVRGDRLVQMVDMVNSLHPDIIILAGDLIDEGINPSEEKLITNTLRRLRAGLGVYFIMGNHEYISGHAEEIIPYLQSAGVKVLRDRWVKAADSFYLVGRDDRSHGDSHTRKNLADLMAGIDRTKPIIVADHQPVNLNEPRDQGVDLQVSGHTHVGQLFPNHLITGKIYEDDWGYLRKGSLQVIVSSGFGTWGPPVRTGNYPEIVDLTINFASN